MADHSGLRTTYEHDVHLRVTMEDGG